jgi:hypothetical protein
MRTSLLLVVLLLGSASSTTVITQVANLPPAAAPASELAPLVERYNLDRAALFRRYDAEYSPERYARLTKFYKDWQQDLASVAFDALGVEGRLDYTLAPHPARIRAAAADTGTAGGYARRPG